jgi:hypothetical protein
MEQKLAADEAAAALKAGDDPSKSPDGLTAKQREQLKLTNQRFEAAMDLADEVLLPPASAVLCCAVLCCAVLLRCAHLFALSVHTTHPSRLL